jgi:hypothetical protein
MKSFIVVSLVFLISSALACDESAGPEPDDLRPCERHQTGIVVFVNESQNTLYNVLVDEVLKGDIAAGDSLLLDVPAGTAHYVFAIADGGQAACEGDVAIQTCSTKRIGYGLDHEPVCVPTLISPASGAQLDNGSTPDGCGNELVWKFEWSECPEAISYQLSVYHEVPGHEMAFNVSDLTKTNYTYRKSGAVGLPSTDGWEWRVRAKYADGYGPWSTAKGFGVEAPDTDCIPPELVTPIQGMVMDNGCQYPGDKLVWEFDWGKIEGATKYHLKVTHPLIAGINVKVDASHYVYENSDYHIGILGLGGWKWTVRAKIDGTWTDWAPERIFVVSPSAGDC